MTAPPAALAGVRVLDLIEGDGAYGPKLLTGLGADVIRVEPPGGGADRRWPPFYQADSEAADRPSLHFFHYHCGKRGVTLDVETATGRELLVRLLDQVEIVFDNGLLARLGFDLGALAEKQPPLVVVSVTPFGQDSARAGWLGGDLIAQAMSGMTSLYGYRDARPARLGPAQASEMSGLAAALAALIALWGMRRSGKGEVVDIAMERVGALVTLQMANASVYHQFGVRRQRRSSHETTHGVLYQASDGYVITQTYREPPRTIAMLKAAGAAGDLPELWGQMPREQFIEHAAVEATIARFVAGMTRAEFVELAQSYGLLCLPVHDAADLADDSFLRGRAYFVEVEHPELGATLTYPGPPVRLTATPYRIARRPPLLGEHNAEVFGALGLSSDELAMLGAPGIV